MALYPGDWLNLAFYILQWDEAVYIHDSYSRTYFVLFQTQSATAQNYSLLQHFFSKLIIYFSFDQLLRMFENFHESHLIRKLFWLFITNHMLEGLVVAKFAAR